MSDANFKETFDQAIKSSDWPLVIVLGESKIAEGGASAATVYNTALAYLKNGKPEQASALLLSIPSIQQDGAHQALLEEALRLDGFTPQDLHLSGQSGVILASSIAGQMRSYPLVESGAFFFALALILGGFRLFRTKFKSKRLEFFLVRMGLPLCFVFGVLCSGLYYFGERLSAHWGVVVQDRGADFFSQAKESSLVNVKVAKGRPVFITGDLKSGWLFARNSSGDSGWVRALDVRVVSLGDHTNR